jgi:hypothetical protein
MDVGRIANPSYESGWDGQTVFKFTRLIVFVTPVFLVSQWHEGFHTQC